MNGNRRTNHTTTKSTAESGVSQLQQPQQQQQQQQQKQDVDYLNINGINNTSNQFMDRNTFATELAHILRQQEEEDEKKKKIDDNISTNSSSNSSSSIQDVDKLIYETYQTLCHDHPMDGTVLGCRVLASALLDHTNTNTNTKSKPKAAPKIKYALSNRLVNGIGHKCIGTSTSSTNRMSTNNNNTSINGTIEEQSTVSSMLYTDRATTGSTGEMGSSSTSAVSLASSYSLLAWTIHVRIPLQCLVSNNLYTCQQLLGSFIVPETLSSTSTSVTLPHDTMIQEDTIIHHDESTSAPVATNGQDQNMNSNEVQNGNTFNGNNDGINDPIDTNSYVEIWATESDPSDYEYESEFNIKHQLAELDVWAEQIQSLYDPISLSQPQQTLTWDNVATTIVYLLSTFTYQKLSSIQNRQWIDNNISDYMTQIIIMLLIQPQQQQNTSIFQQTNTSTITQEEWQKLGVHMLTIFRDVTLEQITTNNNTIQSFILDDYLQLACTLLKVYEVNNGPNSGNVVILCNYSDIPPATWIGLSSLSSMCGEILQMLLRNNDQPVLLTTPPRLGKQHLYIRSLQSLQLIIEQNCDELNILLEITMKKQKDTSGIVVDESIRAIQWSYLSFFQILAKPIMSLSNVYTNDSSSSSTIPNSRCQVILNSGIFRQLLLCWDSLRVSLSTSMTCTDNNGIAIDQPIFLSIEDTIYDLCLGSPNLLGKYAWRFPKFSGTVTTQDTTDSSTTTNVDGTSTINNNNDSTIFYMFICRSFLWNLFGIQLSEGTNPTPTIKWNNKAKQVSSTSNSTLMDSTVVPAATVQSCTSNATRTFQSICQKVLEILTDWKIRREHNLDMSNQLSHQKMILTSFDQLITSKLTSTPQLRRLFCKLMSEQQQQKQLPDKISTDGHYSCNIPQELLSIRSILQNFPVSSSPMDMRKKDNNDNDDNDDNNNVDNDDKVDDDDDGKDDQEKIAAHDKKQKYHVDVDVSIAGTRRAVKKLLSLLEEETGGSTLNLFHRSMSSKAD